MPPEDTTGAQAPTPAPEQPAKKPGFFAKLFGFAKKTEETTPQQPAVTNETTPTVTPAEPTLSEPAPQPEPLTPAPQFSAEPTPTPVAQPAPAPQPTPVAPVASPAPVADITAPSTDTSTGVPQVETPSSPDADGSVTAPEVQVPPSVQTPTPGDNTTLPVQPPQDSSQNPPQNQ